MSKKLLSQRHPALYFLSVWYRRTMRYSEWYLSFKKFAKYKSSSKLPFRIKKHQSVLIRKLGDSDIQLQYNKVANLKIAIKKLDGIIIKPNETFSFCKLVGLPFGSGASIFYNYIDFRFKNNTPYTFQINFWLSKKCLEGELRINEELNYSYHVFERDHKFLKVGAEFYRKNEIWRNRISKFEGGKILDTELIIKNYAKVKYIPEYYEELKEN